jgi:hypothetical protein
MRNLSRQFFDRGWCRFNYDPELAKWLDHAIEPARATLLDPRHKQWHRCGNTWFAGVNVLSNRADGSIADSEPLQGTSIDFIDAALEIEPVRWDAGQISVCFPGYPLAMPTETAGSARYRREHDAAHVDGLLPEGPDRRRHLRELHAFILGIPLVEFDAGAAPFVVWEKSHELVRDSFKKHFKGIPVESWGEEDVTEVYHALRERIFNSCKRVEIHAAPGEAFIAHRLLLHGIAPWQEGAKAGPDGRMICYFRPEIPGPAGWLFNP